MKGKRVHAGRRKDIEKELQRIKTVLPALNVEKALLFGSSARGETGAGSDIDLLIVMKTELPFLERLTALYKILDPQVALDLLVYTPEEMEMLAGRPFIKEILREGVVLYAKES